MNQIYTLFITLKLKFFTCSNTSSFTCSSYCSYIAWSNWKDNSLVFHFIIKKIKNLLSDFLLYFVLFIVTYSNNFVSLPSCSIIFINLQDISSYCLEKLKCSPSPTDNAGYTPLHEACTRGHLKIAKMLLKYGADVSASARGGIR